MEGLRTTLASGVSGVHPHMQWHSGMEPVTLEKTGFKWKSQKVKWKHLMLTSGFNPCIHEHMSTYMIPHAPFPPDTRLHRMESQAADPQGSPSKECVTRGVTRPYSEGHLTGSFSLRIRSLFTHALFALENKTNYWVRGHLGILPAQVTNHR